jgi:tyrosine-protein kinase Etk/Wzc
MIQTPPSVNTPNDVLTKRVEVAAGSSMAPTLTELTPSRIAWVSSLSVILRHKWVIAAVAIIVTTGTAFYAFTSPNVYTATTIVLPPRKAGGGMLDNLTAGLSSTIKDLGITSLKGSEGGAYTPLSLINSRLIREQLVKEFGLVKRYEAVNAEQAEKMLLANLDAKTTEFASFSISFTDKDPALAAKIANRAVGLINETSTRLAQAEARNNLTQIEKRYLLCLADLDSAESRLSRFQKQYGVYSMPDQAKVQAAAIAALEQQKYSTEVQSRMLEQLYGTNSPEVNAMRTSVRELDQKLNDLRNSPDANSSFVASRLMPDAAMAYLRTMREVEIQSKLKGFMLPSYEQAKLDIDKETVAFLTLDPAVPPMSKSGPKRSAMLLIAMIGSVILTSIVILNFYKIRAIKGRFQNDQSALGLR